MKKRWFSVMLTMVLTIIVGFGINSRAVLASEKIELTPENIEEYLTFDLDDEESTVEYVGENVMGVYLGHYEGDVTKIFSFMKQKDLSFEDVKVTIKYTVYTFSDSFNYKFKKYNEEGIKEASSGKEYPEYSYTSTVSIPFDGSKVTDKVEMTIECEDMKTIVDMSERPAGMFFDYEITDVTGYVIKNS